MPGFGMSLAPYYPHKMVQITTGRHSKENQPLKSRVSPLLETFTPKSAKPKQLSGDKRGSPAVIQNKSPHFSNSTSNVSRPNSMPRSRAELMISKSFLKEENRVLFPTSDSFYGVKPSEPMKSHSINAEVNEKLSLLPLSVTVCETKKEQSCGRRLQMKSPPPRKASRDYSVDQIDEDLPLAKKVKKEHFREPHLIGFRNQGATCYLNSVLQALSGLESFCSDVLQELPMMSSQLCPLQSLLRARLAGNEAEVYACLKELHIRFAAEANTAFQNNWDQQDLDEFLTYYLDVIDSQIKYKRKQLELYESSPTLVEKNFSIRDVNRRVCNKCQHEILEEQENIFLRISLCQEGRDASQGGRVSVQELVESTLEGPWDDCISCKENSSVKNLKKLTKIPRTLLVILMRYDKYAQKLQTPVTINPYLVLDKYSDSIPPSPSEFASAVPVCPIRRELETKSVQTDPDLLEIGNPDTPETDNEETALKEALSASLQERMKEEEEMNLAMKESLADLDPFSRKPRSDVVYRLKAVVNHYGDTSNSGHFKCDVFRKDQSQWYNYNDMCVERRSTDAVLQGGEEVCYLLVYEFDGNFDALQHSKIPKEEMKVEQFAEEAKENTDFDESANSFCTKQEDPTELDIDFDRL